LLFDHEVTSGHLHNDSIPSMARSRIGIVVPRLPDMATALRILVSTDFSAGTQSTLAYACEFAERLGAELHLLHVVPVHNFGLPIGRESDDRLRDARQRLERLALPASLSRLGVVCEARAGRPAEEVVRYAREIGSGLVVVSTHGRTGLTHALMGSVTEQVIRTAPCPVLTVRPPPSAGHRADLSEAARGLAAEFGPELVGDRHESWEKMSHLLTRELDLGPAEAAHLLGALESAGAIVWHESAEGDGPARRYWAIHADALGPEAESTGPASTTEEEAEATNAALDLLRHALASRATDIHIDPVNPDQFEVRFRIDGRMEPFCHLDRGVAVPILHQFKILADLDIAEPFKTQEGRLQLPADFQGHEARLTSAPVQGGHAMALRLLSRERMLLSLEGLGLSRAPLEAVERMRRSGAGLVLVTGPTGSGTSTTIYSLLHLLAGEGKNITSIEDPVEFALPFIRQLAVDPRHDLTMTAGLRTILRMDPDVVFVSEIRDVEAAEIVMRGGSAGRYVFSTLHTRDVASTATALRDFHIDNRSLSSNLAGLISQRLVRRLCPECAGRSPTTEEEAQVFTSEGLTPPAELPRAVGCPRCRGKGYRDRIGIFEAVAVTGPAAESILSGAPEGEFRKVLRASGTPSLLADGLQKVSEGITTLEEVQGMRSI
jgi:type II secretory ATPase GspE/PulE/Tfp pilus assembly ATPase PilB-like protein/nucleotide-binding universal stress UspA family protein